MMNLIELTAVLAHGAHGAEHDTEGVLYHVVEYGVAAVAVVTIITVAGLIYRHVSRKAEKVKVRSKD